MDRIDRLLLVSLGAILGGLVLAWFFVEGLILFGAGIGALLGMMYIDGGTEYER